MTGRERMRIPDWLRVISLAIVLLTIAGGAYLDLRSQNSDLRERIARLEVKVDLILKAVDFGEYSRVDK